MYINVIADIHTAMLHHAVIILIEADNITIKDIVRIDLPATL